MNIQPSVSRLLGLDDSELIKVDGHLMHSDIVADWLKLQKAAAAAGFDLAVASSYRSFARQLMIWNDKAKGIRPVYDQHGNPVDILSLDAPSRVHAILRWSALPGGSRHHWGTDLDVYDRSMVKDDYQVQLSEQEVQSGGVFCALHDWLDLQLLPAGKNNFFRPYTGFGAVSAERWHLSHSAVSQAICPLMTAELLHNRIASYAGIDFMLQDSVLNEFDQIFRDYVEPYLAMA